MKKKISVLFIFIVTICAVVFFVFYKISPPKPNLHQAILQALSGATGKYSVVVKDLKTLKAEKQESLYGEKVYKAGSLYKLWIMAETFNQIRDGKFSEEESLSEDVDTLNKNFNIDSESAELTGGKITVTVKDALKQMIEISHNYAALLLTEKIKLSSVSEFLKTNGFKNSHVGDLPTTTADDIALFLEKLYKGELNNAKYTQEMLSLLKAQQLNDKLPKYLPKGTVVAHKTGEIDYVSHDGGIVYTKDRNYIIVVLSDSNFPPGAQERIAQISKAVFNFFLSLPN
jgi:beta-lactamase class A